MTDDKQSAPDAPDLSGLSPEERDSALLFGLALMLRKSAQDLLQSDKPEDARGIIDTLSMMQNKTRGNLTDEEEKLLGGILYELQMAVVAGAGKTEED
ncbi:MAG: DUF1844 domain-containing protein [Gemmatimonadota bacterium]|jgi:hypothetical protein|nr:DUF1844 domain-containing protein [Gemmatimonadota bacterium]MDP6803475.1 DUF1844 domain-containing protein [Gemmatimonadota bacterium]MDP7032597.1 DUF1844 domain-containing protein [Gemmatimonadota bacterium]